MWRFKRWLYRGLTVLRWLLFPVLILALLIGMCIPAAADGYYSYSGKLYGLQDINVLQSDAALTGTLTNPYSEGAWLWNLSSSAVSRYLEWVIPFSFSAKSGDVLKINTSFEGWSHTGFDTMTVKISTSDGVLTQVGSFSNASGSAADSYYRFPIDLNYTFSSDCTINTIVFSAHISVVNGGTINLMNTDFSLISGSSSSPEYPSYTPPSDGGSVSDLGAAESSLTDSAQDGIDKAGAAFAGVDNNLSGYLNGLLMCSRIMGAAMTKLPWLGSVIEISLALGLFASLLGLAAALIGASDRRAAAQARSERSWKQTQARYGPRFFRRRHK